MSKTINDYQIFTLAEIGFAGIFLGEIDLSKKLFEFVQQQRPKNSAGYIGESLILTIEEKYDLAIEKMEKFALKSTENISQAKAVYLFVLSCSGKFDKSKELARQYLKEKTNDLTNEEESSHIMMAKALVDDIEKASTILEEKKQNIEKNTMLKQNKHIDDNKSSLGLA